MELIWILGTVLAYGLALGAFKYVGHNMVFHPIVVGAILITGICAVSDTPHLAYQGYVSPINWLLGPVTVALAIPLYRQIKQIMTTGIRGIWVIVIGGFMAPLIAFICLNSLEFSDPVRMSVLTKSITTPLAMDTAKMIGGLPELAAAVVVFTGIIGVMFSQMIFKLTGCKDPRAKGLALGTVSHAIGTARAHQLDAKIGAFSTMALCVNGILTAIILPVAFMLLG